MPEPSSTQAHQYPDPAILAVHNAEAERLAKELGDAEIERSESLVDGAIVLVERKVRAHRTIHAEDLPGLPEGTVFSCSNGYIHMVREDGKLDSLTLGQGPVAPAFPATVLVEAGDDL